MKMFMCGIIGGITLSTMIVAFMPRRQPQTQIDQDYRHLYEISAGLVHRQRALLEMLNIRGVLTADEVTAVRQMKG